MKKLIPVLCVCAVAVAFISGCGAKKEESSKAAIEKSKSLATVEEQVNYLESQANAFYKSKEYQEAINITQYVINNLDKEANDAKELLEKSTEGLKKDAENVAKDVTNKIKNIGK